MQKPTDRISDSFLFDRVVSSSPLVQYDGLLTCSGGGMPTDRNSTSLGTSPASITSAIGGLRSTRKKIQQSVKQQKAEKFRTLILKAKGKFIKIVAPLDFRFKTNHMYCRQRILNGSIVAINSTVCEY